MTLREKMFLLRSIQLFEILHGRLALLVAPRFNKVLHSGVEPVALQAAPMILLLVRSGFDVQSAQVLRLHDLAQATSLEVVLTSLEVVLELIPIAIVGRVAMSL